MADAGNSELGPLMHAIIRRLRRAGLPIDSGDVRHGVSIEMATDDADGGLFVMWSCGEELIEEVVADTLARRGPTPAMQENFDLNNAMRGAILHILVTGGFDAEMSETDMEVPEVLVRPTT